MIVPLAKGLGLTLRKFFSKPITIQYPEERWECYPRFRGRHRLLKKEDGTTKCVACQLCATVCPSQCIHIETYEDDERGRYPKNYEIDLSRCIFCGFCVEACPLDAIVMTCEYELAKYTREEMRYDKGLLLIE
ncbi:MAG: NADH-quinone oxidoreductase subunit NuoI [Thermodesulfobacteriota bacterium]|nr:NADH-quinone oxidoreductase subunit NuoI [Thermodesulfobacteriota bacterium]